MLETLRSHISNVPEPPWAKALFLVIGVPLVIAIWWPMWKWARTGKPGPRLPDEEDNDERNG